MLEVKITVEAPDLTGAINNLAAAISGKNVSMPTPTAPAPAPEQVQPSATPVASVPLADAPQFTVDQIMAAGATLMDAGKVDALLNLLHSFGVQAVMDLKPEQLGAFATEMRKLGASI